jgi:hypothetical protein
MAESSPPLADTPKAALEAYISELETLYYPWYEGAANRNYWFWCIAQAVAMIAGFGTSILAALLKNEQFKDFNWGRILLIILPSVGSLASTFLIQVRVRELLGLREQGRQAIQYLTETAMVRFAAAQSAGEYTEIHTWLVDQIAAVEREQNKAFFQIVPAHTSKAAKALKDHKIV